MLFFFTLSLSPTPCVMKLTVHVIKSTLLLCKEKRISNMQVISLLAQANESMISSENTGRM